MRWLALIWLLALPATATPVEPERVRFNFHFRGNGRVSHQEVEHWTRLTAQAVADYYGKFPVERVEMVIHYVPGHRVRARTYETDPPQIVIQLGASVDSTYMYNDWILTHEMTHLAFPTLDRRHRWMEEGMATYVEPLIRVRAGQISRRQFWKDMVWGLPKGSAGDDGGLFYSSSWGRTYWGGALFWFQADLEIRRRTGKSLDDVMRGILMSGGDLRRHWPVQRVLRYGDGLVGAPVLSRLYRDMALRPGTVDLEEVWKGLGVSGRGSRVRLVPAPEAGIRDNLTAPHR